MCLCVCGVGIGQTHSTWMIEDNLSASALSICNVSPGMTQGIRLGNNRLYLLNYLTNPKELYLNIMALALYHFRENLSIPPSLCSTEHQTHSLVHASQWLPLSYIPSSRYRSYDFKYIFLIMIFILITILQRSLVHLQFQCLAIAQFKEFCLSLQNLKRKRPDMANNGHSSTTPADDRLLDYKY